MVSRLLRDPGLPVSEPTKSYWLSPPHQKLVNIQSTVLPSTRDVVIIGSGITGCSISWWLLRDLKASSVTVLEAREICSGATGRNGGRINTPAIQDYARYRRLYDHETAVNIVRFELAHFDAIRSIVSEVGPELLDKAEIRSVDAIATAFSAEKVVELKQMLQEFESAFPDLKGVWRVADQEEVVQKWGISNGKGALIGKAGAAWPYRMVTGIFEHLLSKHHGRFSLEANTPALSIHRDTNGEYPYSIATPRGVIHAKHVIHCTEGHVSHLVPSLRGILVPRRGQMTVQNPGSLFPQRGSCSWNFYLSYMDYATQNPQTGELFLGGGDVNGIGPSLGIASDAEQSVVALSHLGGLLPAAFGPERWGHEVPGRARIKASWTGVLCYSLDNLPLVGLLPQELLNRPAGTVESGEWISAGYGGYGMVNAFLCGKALVKMMQGEDVSAWLPERYYPTPGRLRGLFTKLGKVSSSDSEHRRAML